MATVEEVPDVSSEDATMEFPMPNSETVLERVVEHSTLFNDDDAFYNEDKE